MTKDQAVEMLAERGGITGDQAERVYTLYLKERIAWVDVHGGGFKVRHGGAWDRDVIQRATRLDAARTGPAGRPRAGAPGNEAEAKKGEGT